MITIHNITAGQRTALAKIRCAEYLSHRRTGSISSELSALAHRRYSREDYDAVMDDGLARWDNGSVLTERGSALLDDVLAEPCAAMQNGMTHCRNRDKSVAACETCAERGL